MSIAPSDYANTDAEFERILTASLNDCVVLKQDITNILLTKSVCLYVSNLLKTTIIHQSEISNGVTSKCISCYTESSNVFNICKCGLENLCYSCMLAKYVSILTASIKTSKSDAITNNTFNKNYMISLLQNTVCCKYCNVAGFFHKTVSILNHDQFRNPSSNHMLHETDFLNNETKTMIDIFPNMCTAESQLLVHSRSSVGVYDKSTPRDMTSFIQQKNMEALTNYGFELEYDHNAQSVKFKLNPELIKMINSQSSHLNTHAKTDTVLCNVILVTPAIFNAIYYKCIAFGLKNKVIDKTLLFNWNKYCQKMNKLLGKYNQNCNSQMNYYVSVVLINEIKGIVI
jgi:hypothetical protein